MIIIVVVADRSCPWPSDLCEYSMLIYSPQGIALAIQRAWVLTHSVLISTNAMFLFLGLQIVYNVEVSLVIRKKLHLGDPSHKSRLLKVHL